MAAPGSEKPPTAARRSGPPPLAHFRVVDCTDLRGALAGRILADLGAEVIRVEPPAGDPDRLRAPFAGGVPRPDRSLSFLFRNAGKRQVRLDLASAEGRARFAALCDDADLLIENLGPAEHRRLELTPSHVRRAHPRLVHLSISDFGLSGPRAEWRLEALPAFAASGALFGSGLADRAPCWMPGYLAHDCAAAVGVAAALASLGTPQRGHTIAISVQEAAIAGLEPWAIPLADYAAVYPFLPAVLPRDGDGAYPVLPIADGWIRVLTGTPQQLSGLLRLLSGAAPDARGQTPAGDRAGSPPTAEATARDRRPQASPPPSEDAPTSLAAGLLPAWLTTLPQEALHAATGAMLELARLVPLPGATLSARAALLAVFRGLASLALRARQRDEVIATGLQLGVPLAPVNTPDQFVAEAQTRARGFFCATGFAGLGQAPFAPTPFRFSATPIALRHGAPPPDEDVAGFARRPTPPAGRPADGADAPGPGETRTPLAGVRVINLGVGAAVPEMCSLLASLGADVVKIESDANLDFLRRASLEPGRPNRSLMFNDSNRGQRSVCLDLRTARGRELALALCARADVVAENNRGGALDKLGLDEPHVRRLRPDVIYVSSQGFGRGGPLGGARAYGPLASAFAGATWLANHADAPYPAGSSLNHPDHVASKLIAVAVLAALEHRRRTGLGQLIDVSQAEVAAFLMGEVYLETTLAGAPPAPRGNAVAYACPHGVYPAAGVDCWVAVAAVGDDSWSALCRCVGWELEPRWANLPARLADAAEIDRRLAAWTRERSAEDAARALQAAGVSAMAVQSGNDLRADRHLAERRALVALDDPEVGSVRHLANPIRVSRAAARSCGPAPALGADTAEVLREILGLGPAEIAELVAAGVCA